MVVGVCSLDQVRNFVNFFQIFPTVYEIHFHMFLQGFKTVWIFINFLTILI